jgi:ABC-type oligopeptide transport system ATPase subunit
MSSDGVPRPAQVHNADHANAAALLVIATATVAALPGALLGAMLAWAVWRVTRPDTVSRWIIAGLGAATVAVLRITLALAWPWRALLQPWLPAVAAGLTPGAVVRSIPVEALMGPALLVVFQLGLLLRGQTIHGQEWARYRSMSKRRKALERHWQGPTPTDLDRADLIQLRLGVESVGGRPFGFAFHEFSQHLTTVGVSGSGKSTTIRTLTGCVLDEGHGAVIVDFKGSGLGAAAKELAERRGLPFTVMDPYDSATIGYNPCSGDPAAVANKIVGSFPFAGEAEIYKQVAMEAIPVVCRGLNAAGIEISLTTIYEALRPGGLTRVARQLDAHHEDLRVRLEDLDEPRGVGAAGIVGLQRRLGALMEGAFGEIFRKQPALDWAKVTRTPQVTYLSLSTLATSEDVELFGRVILQDLKQVCAERIRAVKQGKAVVPVLIVFDEFAALREPTQVVDLLLQAREAKTPLVVSTQFLPEDASIRRPILSAGVLIIHRVEAEDAEMLAAQFGTHTAALHTSHVDYQAGGSTDGSVRWAEEFNVHPNVLKELPNGVAAVYARQTQRRTIVKVDSTTF